MKHNHHPDDLEMRFRKPPVLESLPLFSEAVETRNDSFHKLQADPSRLQTNRDKVYAAIVELGEASNEEIAKHLAWEINRVCPRVHELREIGKVIAGEKRKCKITGMTVTPWKVKADAR